MALKLRNMQEFSLEIEKLVSQKKLSYLEATLEHLSVSGIEVDSTRIKNILTPKILQKIYEEAIEYNMFGKKKKSKKIETLFK
jgi:hypothetical protein